MGVQVGAAQISGAQHGATGLSRIAVGSTDVWPENNWPSVVGYASQRETYGTGTFTRQAALPPGVQPGDVIVLAMMIAGAAVTPDTTGWSVLAPIQAVGTRSWSALAQVYTSGTTVPVTFTATTGGGHTVGLMVLRGLNLAGLVLGSTWSRPTNGTGASDNRTIAPSMAFPGPGVVIGMHGESTSAVETADPYVTLTGASLVGVQDFQAGVMGSNLEKVLASILIAGGAGTSPDQVATWQNASQNGIATSAFIPSA